MQALCFVLPKRPTNMAHNICNKSKLLINYNIPVCMVLAEPLQKVTCDNAHCDVFSLLAARPDHEVVAEAKEIQKTATPEKKHVLYVYKCN